MAPPDGLKAELVRLLTELFKKRRCKLKRVLQASGACSQELDDGFQQSYENLMRADWTQVRDVRAFVYTVSLNTLRRVACPHAIDRKTALVEPDEIVRTVDDQMREEGDTAGELAVLRAQLARAIAQLPTDQRVVMELSFRDLSPPDIARALNVPVYTVMYRLGCARQRVESLMTNEPHGDKRDDTIYGE